VAKNIKETAERRIGKTINPTVRIPSIEVNDSIERLTVSNKKNMKYADIAKYPPTDNFNCLATPKMSENPRATTAIVVPLIMLLIKSVAAVGKSKDEKIIRI